MLKSKYISTSEVSRMLGVTARKLSKMFPGHPYGKILRKEYIDYINAHSVALPKVYAPIKMRRDVEIAKTGRKVGGIHLTVANIHRMCAPTRYNILPHVRIGDRSVLIPDGIIDQYEGYINSRVYVDMRRYIPIAEENV